MRALPDRPVLLMLAVIRRLPSMAQRPSLKDILRIRRQQPTRLEGFVDSAFAFAVTLIVISTGHAPTSVTEMLQSLRGLPTFGVCFLLIARFWASHRDWSRHYDLEDTESVTLSLLLVFLVLIYVYPLHLLFAFLFAGLSNSWLMDQNIDLHGTWELRAAYVVYGLGFLAIALVFAQLFRHALNRGNEIGLNAAERVVTQMRVALWLCTGAVSLLSVLLALLLPFDSLDTAVASLPGQVYLLIFLVRPFLRRIYLRRLPAPSAMSNTA
jgi:uncharacterized membrane protein